MGPLVTTLFEYTARIAPGLALIALTFALLPRAFTMARILVLILGFILVRDVMTPLGIWTFGLTGTAVWIRFRPDAALLFSLALTSGALVFGLLWGLPQLRALVRWGNLRRARAWLWGLGGAVVVLLPLLLLGSSTPLAARGGAVPTGVLPGLLAMALVGNLLEELLFRGFLQERAAQLLSVRRAVLLGGVAFAAGHVFLASTVTDLGAPVLLFTLAEGLVCAEVYRREGLLASTLSHGLIIFVLAAGLF